MGQKVNPHGMRVGVINDWNSKWFAEKNYAAQLVEDTKIRQFLKKHLFVAGISKIGIKRVGNRVKIAIYTAKPGMVIGRGGTGCLLYTSPSPRDGLLSRMPSSA